MATENTRTGAAMPGSDEASGALGDAGVQASGSASESDEVSRWVARAQMAVAEAGVWLPLDVAEAWRSALPLVERMLQWGWAWWWATETVMEWEFVLLLTRRIRRSRWAFLLPLAHRILARRYRWMLHCLSGAGEWPGARVRRYGAVVMGRSQPTPYLEANAILAAQEKDWDELDRIMAEMEPGEVRALGTAAYWLGSTCGRRLREMGEGNILLGRSRLFNDAESR